jgi:hypothetical protein
MDLAAFIETVVRFGLERFGRFYSLYRGEVMRNDDPESRGRIQVMVPQVGHKQGAFPDRWVGPSEDGAGADRGSFFPPEVGDSVWVTFLFGDPSVPGVYYGGWYGYDEKTKKAEAPAEFKYSNKKPQRRGFVTRMGHVFQFVDEPGQEAVRLVWHKPDPADAALTAESKSANRKAGKHSYLVFEANGDVMLANQNGSLVHLDAANNQIKVVDSGGSSVTLGPANITLLAKDGSSVAVGSKNVTMVAMQGGTVTGASFNAKVGGVFLADGADSPAVRGRDLMTWLGQLIVWLATHTHPTPAGPSSPPAAPPPTPPPTILSQRVKLA